MTFARIKGSLNRAKCKRELCDVLEVIEHKQEMGGEWWRKHNCNNILRLFRNCVRPEDAYIIECLCARLWWVGYRSEVITAFAERWYYNVNTRNFYLAGWARHRIKDILVGEACILPAQADVIAGTAYIDYVI